MTAADRLNAAGIDHARAGDLVAAEDAFSAAVLADPTHARAWNNRGLVRRLGGWADAALFDFDMAVSRNPGYAEALGNRGVVRHALGDLAGADADLTRAVERTTAPADRAGWVADRAAVRLAAGDPASARADADAVLAVCPDHPAALEVRGKANTALGDLPAAVADLDRAVALASAGRLPHLLHARAAVAVARKRFAAAVADYDWALALDPGFVIGYVSRGHARFHLNDRRALDDYRTACRLDPSATVGELVRVARGHTAREPEATLANCRKHLRVSPDDALAHLRLGLTLVLLGRADEAVGPLARGADLAPGVGTACDRLVAVARGPLAA